MYLETFFIYFASWLFMFMITVCEFMLWLVQSYNSQEIRRLQSVIWRANGFICESTRTYTRDYDCIQRQTSYTSGQAKYRIQLVPWVRTLISYCYTVTQLIVRKIWCLCILESIIMTNFNEVMFMNLFSKHRSMIWVSCTVLVSSSCMCSATTKMLWQ